MVIYLTRHGETELNLKGIHQGQRFDSPLTQKGIEHAKRLGQMFKGKHIDYLFTSDLGRAVQTARIIGDIVYLYPTLKPELREITFGLLDGTTKEEREEKYASLIYEREKDKINYRYPEGENYKDVFQRVKSFTDDLKNKFTYQTIALIGHEAVNRVVLMSFLDLTFEDVFKTKQPNEVIYLIILPERAVFFSKNYGGNWQKGLYLKK